MKVSHSVIGLIFAFALTVTLTSKATNRVLVISPDSTGATFIDDCVTVPHSSQFLSSQFTIEAWLYRTRVSNPSNLPMYIFGKGIDNNIGTIAFCTFFDDPNMRLAGYVRDAAMTPVYNRTSIATVSTGYWFHVAWSYDVATSNELLYLNGSLVASTNGAHITPTAIDPVFIGRHNGPVGSESDYPWHGYMDEVRFWNRPLSQTEIATNMYKTLSGSEAGLVGYWNFDDSTAKDISTNGHNGTFLGAATTAIKNVPLDQDIDGIPDWWTELHFGHTTGQVGDNSLATDDPDGDRYTNFEEYQNGSDPIKFDIGQAMIWTAIELGWKSVSGTNYQVQACTDLASSNWNNIGNAVIGNGSTNFFFDTTRTNVQKFYRVVVP